MSVGGFTVMVNRVCYGSKLVVAGGGDFEGMIVVSCGRGVDYQDRVTSPVRSQHTGSLRRRNARASMQVRPNKTRVAVVCEPLELQASDSLAALH